MYSDPVLQVEPRDATKEDANEKQYPYDHVLGISDKETHRNTLEKTPVQAIRVK